jgi:RIO-like serine/threonine protein kinase
MSKLKAAINLQIAFGAYRLDEQLGEGGAGRVYGGVDDSGAQIAIKVHANFLRQEATSKARFT